MNSVSENDLIIGVRDCIEANYCAIGEEELFKKFKNTDKDTLRYIISVMKEKGILRFDESANKYRLTIR